MIARIKGIIYDPGNRKSAFLSIFFCLSLLCSLSLLLDPPSVNAMTISADHLEHFQEDDKFVGTGNVKMEKDKAVIQADKVIFYRETSDLEATGHVVYEDTDAVIRAEQAELNLDSRTGTLHNAVILFKKDNYWITGNHIEKIEEDHYYAERATFTTCDSKPYLTKEAFLQKTPIESSFSAEYPKNLAGVENPDWCFKGDDVDITLGEKITAKNVVYRIQGLPVLYTPYLWTSIDNERQTGFLTPIIGNSTEKGFEFSPAFYWAIDDDKDASFYLDYYSKRGIAEGLEFRYANPQGVNQWYIYHLYDTQLREDFVIAKVAEKEQWGDIKGFLDINYLNNIDFYTEYGAIPDTRMKRFPEFLEINRFLQSSGELSLPLTNSRLYLLSQYWVDLQTKDAQIEQRLPELGYVINPTRVGPLVFTLSSAISNFYNNQGPQGQRLFINPTLSHSFGDAVQVFQSLSLREAAYNLQNVTTTSSTPHWETFQYTANALMRFFKEYPDFTHIIEPSLQYIFIPDTKTLPTLDSTEVFNKTSQVQFSLLNTLAFKNFSIATRLTQPYALSTEVSDESLGQIGLTDNIVYQGLGPTELEASISGPFTLRLDVTYDFRKGTTDTANSEITVKLAEKTTVSLGERYDVQNNINFYTMGFNTFLMKDWSVSLSAWYDASGNPTGSGLRNAAIKTLYNEKCWGVEASFERKPSSATTPVEYSFAVMVELKGFGKFRL